MTYDQAVQSNVFTAYAAAKSLAEKAVWDFVDTHKHLEVTSFCPPYFYGPFAPGFSIPPNDYSAISTTKLIHRFLTPAGTFPPFAGRPLPQ
jgi:nucleoside-diphosphate-sugar epimerase